MSQIRKSASFRSRIPIRRSRLAPRRCYSPEPYNYFKTAAMCEQNQNDYDTHPICNHGDQRISKQKMKRQRHVATTLAQHAQHTTKLSKDASITNISAPIRPKTIYSSSSYSSSDESQESEAPPQVEYIRFINVNWVKISNILPIDLLFTRTKPAFGLQCHKNPIPFHGFITVYCRIK